MRIVIDLQGAQSGSRSRGIGRYSLSLALAMVRQRKDNEVVLALNGLFPETIEPIRAAFDNLLPQDNIRVWHAPGPVSFADPKNSSRRAAAELVREAFLAELAPDLVHVTSLFEGLGDDVVATIGRLTDAYPSAVTVYDLIPHIHADHYLTGPRARDWYYNQFQNLHRASLLLAISESSRKEAIAHVGRPELEIVATGCAADARFKPLSLNASQVAAVMRRYKIARPFVMCTGGDDDRKNMEGLVRAYAGLPRSFRLAYQLVIVCALSDARRNSLLLLALKHGLSPDELILTGRVSDEDLVLLYNLCTLFAFPSWHEGFGLPVLEAMSCGAPVIGANTTSIPEVIDRKDALFDPHSDESMSAMLSQALADNDFRTGLARYGLARARSFSWDASAERAISAFEEVHKRRQSTPRSRTTGTRRPRLAYVSPLPPDRSGIAHYSAELIPELARHYEIELIASNHHARQGGASAQGRLRTPNWLRANAYRFDRVLYHFGNSQFHDYMFDLLADVPGVVVLHDFFLSGVLAHLEHENREGRFWVRALYRSHGYSAVRERFKSEDGAAVILKYPANYQVLQQSRGVIVHSDYARRLADLWYGSEASRDWAVIPLLRTSPCEVDRRRARAALGIAEDTFLVCSLGIMGPTKLNHRTLDAWLGSSFAADEKCRLVFVGAENPEPYGAAMRKAIDRSAAADRIDITDWVDRKLYHEYLAAADIAVQLRAHTRGETSATVLDCMNYGLPTIVNACGATAELPSDAVWMLPEKFDDKTLAAALETLRRDPGLRATLAKRARQVIETDHSPSKCAAAYAEAIERFYAKTGVADLVDAIAGLDDPPSADDCKRLAAAIDRNHPAAWPMRRLFVDVSQLVMTDFKTGIQRAVRSILLALVANPPPGIRVEPIYASTSSERFRLRKTVHARSV